MTGIGSAVVDFTHINTKYNAIMDCIFKAHRKHGMRLAGFIPGSGIYEL